MNCFYSKKIQHSVKTSTLVFHIVLGSLQLLLFPQLTAAQEIQGGCGTLKAPGRYGPFDYRPDKFSAEAANVSYKGALYVVESSHFTPIVEAVIRGSTSTTAGGDLNYTLHVFPNHHRALISMVKLGEKEKTNKPIQTSHSIDCWFYRAIAMAPDDNVVRMLFANYLNKNARPNEAVQQLNIAAQQAGDNALTYNNIGLIYFNMKSYDQARIYAHKAYALGLPNPALRDQLKSAGQWSEQVPM